MAAVVGAVLLVLSGLAVLVPPSRQVALDGCTPAPSLSCTVRVDSDLNTFAAAVAAFGVAGLLISLLGIRFTKVSAGGVSVEGFEQAIAGLPEVHRTDGPTGKETTDPATSAQLEEVEAAYANVPELPPFKQLSGDSLNRIRHDLYDRNHRLFLTHLLGPAAGARQRYRAAIFLCGHQTPVDAESVTSATMFLGRGWGNRTFEASWGTEGRLGIVVEAYGPFLVLCEVTLTDGTRVVLHHYVDFYQGELIA